jgi:hypothetical protein
MEHMPSQMSEWVYIGIWVILIIGFYIVDKFDNNKIA